MLARILATALIAGAIAGVFVFAAHMVRAVPLIERAEVYEKAAAKTQTGPAAVTAKADQEWEPEDGLERAVYTLIFDLVTGVGFALVLAGAIALRGRSVDWLQGILWGLAGFAVFSAAPSFGLPPEIPGMQAAPIVERQLWWLLAAAATAAGLGLIAFAGPVLAKGLGLALILFPHVVGAPGHDPQPGLLPAELAAEFAAVSLVTAGLFWMVLGGLTGYLWPRLARS